MSMNLKEEHLSWAFRSLVSELKSPAVLELGTKQSVPGTSTMSKTWVPHAKSYHGTDMQDGEDVDLVADVHELSKVLQTQNKIPKKFDVIVSVAAFEHILNPFVAAKEIAASMNPGGLLFIATHNCFPIHEYPCDYWRYSIESLSYVVAQAGLEVIDAAYTDPAAIHSVDDPSLKYKPAFLKVSCYARKLE